MVLRIDPSRRHGRLNRQSRSRTKVLLGRCSLLMLLTGTLWYSYKQVRSHFLQPEAVLVLGGAPVREVFAAEFAKKHPHLEIWVSSGTNPEYAEWVFSEAGIDRERLHLDYQAVDTVTNFTTLVDELKARQIESIYLITSDDHMRRAQVIGEIVLGSRGIDFKPIAVPSGRETEPIEKAIRDGARAVLWLVTGTTGENLIEKVKSHRQFIKD